MPLVGIDIGTQSLKAVVTDDALAVLGDGSVPYAIDYPRAGWAQQDPHHWLDAVGPAIASALAAARLPPDAITAVGVTGQLDGCLAVDRQGAPRGPCLIWMDRRAADRLPALDPADVRRRTGVNLDASHLGAKARWLLTRAVGLADARFHQPVSFLVERLTGRYVYDRGLASTTMLYDLATGDHDDALLEAFGLTRAQLPAIEDAAAPAGPLTEAGARLTGLLPGTAVAVGTGDDFTTPLGAGLVAPGRLACVLGTAEVVGALADRPRFDDGGLVECHAYPGGGFFVENPGWLAGGALTWLGELLSIDSAAALDRLAAAVPPGADGLAFLPALSGAMAPRWNAGARACFYGLTPAHGKGHLARAVLEACAFAMRDVADRLAALAVPVERVLLIGGGARSDLWAQIRADVLGLPVERAAHADAAPVGAALLAAVAAGASPSIVDAAARLPSPTAPLAPSRARYDEPYARYRALFDALEPVF